jgi:dihydrofolate reductase
MIKLIVAHDPNNLIGQGDKMPWHIKEELAFFKQETLNQALLMGQKTFQGLPKALPNRTTYVLTNDKDFKVLDDNVRVIYDAPKLLDAYQDKDEILFIAGGRSIYEQFYPYADELIISTIKDEYQGDVYFVDIDYTKYNLIEETDHNIFIVRRYRKK